VVYVGDGRQGFDFLGFHCRKVESWKYRGHRYLQRRPSRRAMQRVRDRIKAITAPRHRLPEPVGPIVAEVNQVPRGWGAYFRVGNSTRKFQTLDRYARERLAKFLAKKAARAGHQRQRYTGAFFAKLGV
jgi:RNA-directed DNA polymerase